MLGFRKPRSPRFAANSKPRFSSSTRGRVSGRHKAIWIGVCNRFAHTKLKFPYSKRRLSNPKRCQSLFSRYSAILSPANCHCASSYLCYADPAGLRSSCGLGNSWANTIHGDCSRCGTIHCSLHIGHYCDTIPGSLNPHKALLRT
jgi:hypothetical protein